MKTEFCGLEKCYGKSLENITGYILVGCFDQNYYLNKDQCKLGETLSVSEIIIQDVFPDGFIQLSQGYKIYTEKPKLIMKFYPSRYILSFETTDDVRFEDKNVAVIKGYIPEGSDIFKISEKSFLTNAFHPVSVSVSLGKLTDILEETFKDLGNLYI